MLYLLKTLICIALLSGALGAWYVLWLGGAATFQGEVMGKKLSNWQIGFLIVGMFGGAFSLMAFTPILPILALIVAPFFLFVTSIGIYFAVCHFFKTSTGVAERSAAFLGTVIALLQLVGFAAGLWESWLENWKRVLNFY